MESRTRYAKEALEAVTGALGVDKFDTLILSLPNIVLEKDEEDYKSKEFPVPDKTAQSWAEAWKVIRPQTFQLMKDNGTHVLSWSSIDSRGLGIRYPPSTSIVASRECSSRDRSNQSTRLL